MGYRDYSTAKGKIVDATGHGDFTTIASALTAASSGQTIFIRPGTYTENPTLKAGVNLVAFDADATTPNVIINGKCTFTAAGTVSLSGIQLQTNSDFCLAVTGSAASIVYLNNCYLNCTNNTGISFSSSSSSATIYMFNVFGNLGTTGIAIYSMSSTGTIRWISGYFSNTGASTTASSNSAGVVYMNNLTLLVPLSASSTGGMGISYCNVNTSAINTTALATTGTGNTSTDYSDYISGTASALSVGSGTTVQVSSPCRFDSSNTNAITGGGTLDYSLLTFTSSSSTNNVTTQTAYVTQPTTNPSAWVLLQTQTASTSASIAFNSSKITSTYKNYAVVLANVIPATNEVGLNLNVSTNNGSTYLNSGYNTQATIITGGGVGTGTSTTTAILTSNASGTNAISNSASGGYNATIFLQNITTGSGFGTYLFNSVFFAGSSVFQILQGGGLFPTTSTINNIQFIMSSGNITSGTFSLYGITS